MMVNPPNSSGPSLSSHRNEEGARPTLSFLECRTINAVKSSTPASRSQRRGLRHRGATGPAKTVSRVCPRDSFVSWPVIAHAAGAHAATRPAAAQACASGVAVLPRSAGSDNPEAARSAVSKGKQKSRFL